MTTKNITPGPGYTPDNLPAWSNEWFDAAVDGLDPVDYGWPCRRIADDLLLIEHPYDEAAPHILMPDFKDDSISGSTVDEVIAGARAVAAALLEAAEILETLRWTPATSSQPPFEKPRRERDIKHYELAIDTGIGTDELSFRMTGKRPFDTDDIDLIAKGLGLTPWDLLSRAAE